MVGTEYSLTFYAANFGREIGATSYSDPNEIQVTKDGTVIGTTGNIQLASSEIQWNTYSLTFTATSSSHLIQFETPRNLIGSEQSSLSIDGISLTGPSPVPTITSATYDASTGTLIVTGTNFVANAGAVDDVDVSLLTLRGEGGTTYTLTSSGVEIDSATRFTITLNATDKAALAGVLNKSGTASDDSTTYNIAAAEDWLPGAPAADDIADLVGNALTVFGLDETPPTAAFSPANGATNIARDGTITITFDEAVRLLNGAALTNENIDALITLKDTDGNGANIPFDATINGNVVTIRPSTNFASSQQVYVAIGATVEDEAENSLTPASLTFTVIDYIAPTLVITGPSEPVTEAFTVTFTFSEDVTGFNFNDINIAGGNLSNFAGSNGIYTVRVTPILGATVTLSVGANAAEDATGNGNQASNRFTIQAGSPASEFEANRRVVEDLLLSEMTHSVQSNIATSTRMVRGAKGRLIAAQGCVGTDDASAVAGGSGDGSGEACSADTLSNTVRPLDIDGVASANGTTISTRGTAQAEVRYGDGQSRRLLWGDFDLQHDGDSGRSTATFSGRMIWEQMRSENTMLGYFIGAEFNDSEVGGFVGDQTRLGVNFGGYVVQRVRANLFADGYLSFGLGKSDLDISTRTLDLKSNYGSQNVTTGASLSGLYAYERHEFRPELSINHGRSELGNVAFTGNAYGITDNTLSLNAGSVTVTNLTLRPELLIAVDGGAVAQSLATVSFAPRLLCERITSTLRADTEECGAGAELGFKAGSENGLSTVDFRIAVDEIGQSRRSSANLGVEIKF